MQMGSPDWNASMVDIRFRNLLWGYCPGHSEVKGNDRADRLASKATITTGLPLWRHKVLRGLRRYVQTQRQGHHTIDRLDERGVERVRRSTTFLERIGPSSSRPTLIWNCFKGDDDNNTIQYNTIQLYCLYVEKFAFWLVIYIKTFNTVNNKTSTTQ